MNRVLRAMRGLPVFVKMLAACALVLVACVCLVVVVPLYRQTAALNTFDDLGITYTTASRVPEWVRDWLGDESALRYDRVVAVSFLGIDRADTVALGLTQLRGLPDVAALSLADTPFTDDLAIGLYAPRALVELDLSGTMITGVGLKRIMSRVDPSIVFLDRTQVDDESLAVLDKTTAVSLADTNVTDGGLRALRACRRLAGLSVDGTRITDTGMNELADIRMLSRLSVRRTKVTDAGLLCLKALPNLKAINVRLCFKTRFGAIHAATVGSRK